jgi:hypothetical protein
MMCNIQKGLKLKLIQCLGLGSYGRSQALGAMRRRATGIEATVFDGFFHRSSMAFFQKLDNLNMLEISILDFGNDLGIIRFFEVPT